MKTLMLENELKGLSRKETYKVVLLHSGGADSTAAGFLLKEAGFDVIGYFIDYGQPNANAEYLCACQSAKKLDMEVEYVDVKGTVITGDKWQDDNTAFVPCRNTLFMTLAAIAAYKHDADGIAIGFMKDDMGVFGDNDFSHHKMMEAILSKSLGRPMEVFLPIMSMWKKDIIELLRSRNLLDLTVSCWNAKIEDGQVVTCGGCAQCLERNSK